MTPDTITPADLLAVRSPEEIFSPDRLPDQFRALVRRFHPDRGGDPAIFHKVVQLHDRAREKIDAGTWGVEGQTLFLDSRDGKRFRLSYRRLHAFELGEVTIAHRTIAFLVRREHERLFCDGVQAIGTIRYPDAQARRGVERFMPFVAHTVETPDQIVAVMKKTPDLVLLDDLLQHLGGQLDPRHTAWVVSSLLSLACFFSIAGLAHNGLSTRTVLVSPRHHAVYPWGGWWYARRFGEKLQQLPPDTHAIAPAAVLRDKVADHRLDLESIRAIARACLGDATGATLRGRTDIPKPFADWACLPAAGSAVQDYRAWEQARDNSFGARRFIELNIDSSDIYP